MSTSNAPLSPFWRRHQERMEFARTLTALGFRPGSVLFQARVSDGRIHGRDVESCRSAGTPKRLSLKSLVRAEEEGLLCRPCLMGGGFTTADGADAYKLLTSCERLEEFLSGSEELTSMRERRECATLVTEVAAGLMSQSDGQLLLGPRLRARIAAVGPAMALELRTPDGRARLARSCAHLLVPMPFLRDALSVGDAAADRLEELADLQRAALCAPGNVVLASVLSVTPATLKRDLRVREVVDAFTDHGLLLAPAVVWEAIRPHLEAADSLVLPEPPSAAVVETASTLHASGGAYAHLTDALEAARTLV